MNITILENEQYSAWKKRVQIEAEIEYVKAMLTQSKGNISGCSRVCKMDRNHLLDLVHKHGLTQWLTNVRSAS